MIMNFEMAKEKAIKYLGISRKTEYEVFKKLKDLNCEEEIINNVIIYLRELGYLNDEEYVDAYIRQCVRLLNYSIYEIKMKLLQKGIKKYIIEEKLDELEHTDYEKKIKNKLLDTKCKNMELQKQKAYLYRRGFKID